MVSTPELELIPNTSVTYLNGAGTDSTVVESTHSLNESQKQLLAEMAEDLSKWGIGLIVMGVISLALSAFLDPLWGLLMIIVGVLARMIHHRTMYLVIGGGLLLIGLSNMFAGEVGGWTVFGVMQLVWGYQELRKYSNFAEVGQSPVWQALRNENHGALGIISAATAVGTVLFFYIVITGFSALELLSPATFGLEAENAVVDLVFLVTIIGSLLLHVVGLLFGIGGLFQRKRRKGLAAVGLIGNIALLVGYGVLMMTA